MVSFSGCFQKNDSGATNGYLKAYLNGILEATHNSVDQATTPTSNLFIGSHDSSNYRFSGQISDVQIYDKALTADQVNELYHERSSVYHFEEKTNLKLHLPLNHSLKDISGNGYNGSFFGGNPSYVENYKGDKNGALNFDGSNDYVSIGDISDFEYQKENSYSVFFG